MTDDYASSVSTTGSVAVGGSATGEIERVGDRDWFAVTLEAGKTYWIDLEGSTTSAGTLSNPYLRGLYDAAGNLISGTTNNFDGAGYNSRVTFTANEDATYYVSAGTSGFDTGTYTLSVTDITNGPPHDDFTAGAGTAGTVAVDGSATGEIEFGFDRDWFAVTLEAGKSYQFDLEGLSTNAGNLLDPYLSGLYDAAGNLIAGTTNADSGVGGNSRVAFTATANATYYVSAGAYQSETGTYTLSVRDITDDFTARTDTAGVVAVGGSATGEIEIDGDRDWFAVTLEAGKTYQFDLEGWSWSTSAGTLWDPYLRGLHDAAGNLIAGTTSDGGGAGRNSRLEFTATANATYYVSAGTWRNYTGTYTLSVEEFTDDFTAGTDTAGTVAVGGSATGEIEFGSDRDWFAVTLEADKTYRFDLEGSATSAGTLADPYLRGLYDAARNLIAGTTNDDGGTGRNSRLEFTATANATYYVSAGANGSRTGTYTLSVEEVPDDFTAGTDTAGTVAVGGSATGEIELGGDRDWFAVTLEADKSYRFDLKGSATSAGTLSDPYLYGLYDAAGNLIAGTTSNDGGDGRNSRVAFEATANATYYVSAGANGSRTGTYTLSVEEVPDDFTAGTGTAGTVAVGGSATGEIEFVGDRDWFAVTLEADKTYRFDLEGSPTSAGNLYDTYLRGLYNAAGNLISGTTNDDGGDGRNSRVAFTATANATYYVSAGAYGSRTGTYTLSVEEVPDDDFTAGTGTAGTVAVGGSATGEIERGGDRDWFAVTLEAGKTYRFDLEGSTTSAGTLVDPYLRGLYDAAGNLIAGTTNNNGGDGGDGRNSRVAFTATANATYYVSAGANDSRTGTYTLSVEEVPDDFTAGTGTAGTVAVGGSATGELEFRFDRDWFAVTLEAGKTYRIDLGGLWTNAGSLIATHLYGLYDAAGNLITGTTSDDRRTGSYSRVAFTATADATYYVSAGAWGSRTGTYTLSVRDVTSGITDDFTAGTDTAGAVEVGGSATGEIGIGGDRDWFAVTLDAGKTYRIDLEAYWTNAGNLVDPYLYGLYDAAGNLISDTTDDHGGDTYNSRVVFTATVDATYYVSAGAGGSGTGTYTLLVEEVTDDDFTAGTDTAGAVEVGGSATGEIEFGGDRDWFAVTLEAGKPYRIDLEGTWTSAGTLSDTYLYGLYDSAGNLISDTTDYNGGYGRNSRVAFTATANATYYVSAGTFGDNAGTYTLSVEEVTNDDFTAETATAGTVAVGGSATGAIERGGDRDWFAVTLEAGKPYRFDLEGSPTSAGNLPDTYLRGLYDAAGNRIRGTTNDDGGTGYNSRVDFTATADATYYVSAGAYGSRTGTYTLSVEEVTNSIPDDDFTARTDTAGTVAVGGSTTGDIEIGFDRDWFAVTLDGGKTYRFDLEGSPTSAGNLSDPYLRGLYDATGNLIRGTTNDDGGTAYNSRVTFTANEDATYYVSAGAYGYAEGTYTLSVEEVL